MDLEGTDPSTSLVKCCDCGCSFCSMLNRSFYGTSFGSVKRKRHEVEETSFVVPGLDISQIAKVEIGNECVMLREMVSNQQEIIQDFSMELEEERNAASSAANEAMSMILRLQREKAEVQMESRQFKRFAEEKMAHDGEEISVLEELLYKREQSIQSLTCEVHAYKHRLMSYGLTEAESEGGKGGISRNNSMVENFNAQYDLPTFNYPPLKCNLIENHASYGLGNDAVDVKKYAFGETPRSHDHLKDLEDQINQLEQSPRQSRPDVDLFGTKHMLEKVVVGHSPRRYRHFRKSSTDSSSSAFVMVRETGSDGDNDSPKLGGAKKKDCIHSEEVSSLRKADNASEVGDDMSDRVYTIDAVHNGASYSGKETNVSIGIGDEYMSTPVKSQNTGEIGDPDIKKLYMRLQVLEADRESMKQALISMRTDKAQLVLLKEIAQQLCKDASPARPLPLSKPSVVGSFSFMAIFKWIVSFVFWRKRSHRSRYMSGMSPHNVGLLMLLDKGTRAGRWRCISSTQV